MTNTKPWVLIIMGSDSDAEVMSQASAALDEVGVPYTFTVASAHRSPERTKSIIEESERDGAAVFIAGAGILAAFANAATLVALTAFLFVEAFQRLSTPHAVNSTLMLATAAVAVVLNGGAMLLLRADGKDDVNIRSAVLHMLSDAVASAGIIVAAILIRTTNNAWWDPAVSIAIGVLILWSSWGILKETINLLLEGTPSGIDPAAVQRAIESVDGVFGVHHLHIWALGPSSPALSCHIMVGDVAVKSTGSLLDRVNEVLAHEFRIAHSTIQFEFANCAVDDPYCVPYSAR
jgi:cobalt-zinc-cadmium efflux system protein